MNASRLLGATALASSLLLVSAAHAQTAPAGQPADQETTGAPLPQSGSQQEVDNAAAAPTDVVVTGSRISRPNDVSTIPITTVTAAELGATARTSVGDVLNDLPALASTFSQANSTRFLGTAGLNLLDLRGLGTQRTLVLVNGRRHVGADVLSNAVSPDVNTFPTDLIERVDVLTGGSSAVYGSDALAGVVNFVLKQDFEGLQLRGQGGVSQYGDAGTYFLSALGGVNFADGRGNIAVNLEYARNNEWYASGRGYLSRTDAFVTTDADSAGLAGGNLSLNSDGVNDATFFRDVRVGTFSDGGLVAFAGAPLGANSAARCGRDKDGRAFTCNYLFQPNGSFVQQTGSRVGLAGGTAANPSGTPAGAFIGGNGNTRREGQLVQLQPRLDRYSANIIGHFEVSPAFVPFFEAKYVRTDVLGQGTSGPAFFTGSTLDGTFERPRLDNPYLDPTARATIASQLLTLVAAGQNPASGAAITAAQAATLTSQINSGSYRFILRKNLTDLGVRSEESRRETYRGVFGVRGDFNDDWKYEISANYGEFKEATKVLGNLNVQRALLALDAVRSPSGQIVCGAQLDPNRANSGQFLGIPGQDLAGNPAILAADIAACQPLNPFGVGNISDAARNYVLTDTISRGKITQFDVQGFVSGDTSGFFNLPGGAIGFSVGGEYRRETASYIQDDLVKSGYTFYNAIPDFDPPSFEVKEAFAEVRLPILKDFFLANELTVTGAGRVSDYKGSAGTVYAYNIGVDYAPIRDLRFRGQYARAVRAPNLADLFTPNGQNFAPGFVDPCAARNIASGTQFREANCRAAGIPAGFDFQYAQSLGISSGGNPNLDVEKSDSYTYGAVFQPSFAPGLTLSVDYYNIRVKDVITAPSAQGIANNCYDSPTTNNQFCALFQRVAAGGTGPAGEEPFRIIEGSLQQNLLNYASLKVRGIDTDLAYTRKFGNVQVGTHLIYTHQLENNSFLDVSQPGFANTALGEIGFPKDAFNWNVTADFGSVFIFGQARYLSKMTVGAIENRITFQGRPPQNNDDFDRPYYPDVVYFDTRFGFNISAKSNFYMGVDNLTNRRPPLGSTGTGGGTGIYDPVGRRFYAGIQARF